MKNCKNCGKSEFAHLNGVGSTHCDSFEETCPKCDQHPYSDTDNHCPVCFEEINSDSDIQEQKHCNHTWEYQPREEDTNIYAHQYCTKCNMVDDSEYDEDDMGDNSTTSHNFNEEDE